MGNPASWWGSTMGVLLLVAYLLSHVIYGDARLQGNSTRVAHTGAFLLAGFLLNWAPYVAITRVCFVYHYLPAVYFAFLITGLMVDFLLPMQPPAAHGQYRPYGASLADFLTPKGLVCCVAMAAVTYCFVVFLPWTYGWPLSTAEHDARRWLDSWR
mmetsp:Transcript_23452/g.58684  ORF Transcript_23452/g.58684 Transcript_23452/m.58684 type:complete len:156 (-) Transcript_23452:18-485(-)